MAKNIEYTFIMIKPDGVEKEMLDDVLKRFKDVGLEVLNIKEMKLSKEVIREHYAHIVDKPFYPEVEEYILSGPVIAMIVRGENVISKTRELMGPTKYAEPGTIRGDYRDKVELHKNAIHGSDSVENAIIEIARFYNGLTIQELEKSNPL